MTTLDIVCCFLLCLFTNIASLMFVAEIRERTKKRRRNNNER